MESRFSDVFVSILVVTVSVLFGVVLALGIKKLDIVLVGAIAGAMVLFIPLPWIYFGLAILVFLIVGQLQYFGGLREALWIPYMITLGLYLRVPLEYLKNNKTRGITSARLPSLLLSTCFFICTVMISTLMNFSPLIQLLVGGKNYVAFWSLLLLLWINGNRLVDLMGRLWKNLLVIAVLQLPFVLYQYFFVAPKRSTQGGIHGVAWDAVVGSFGGDPQGGGASGTMAFALVLALTLSVLLWKKQLTRIWLVVVTGSVAFAAILLAEVKVVLVLLPVAISLVYRREVVKRPASFAFAFVFVASILVSILLGYEALHYQSSAKSDDLAGLFGKSFGYSLDPDLINMETREMGRSAAIAFWWQENGFDDLFHTLFGYGAGASRSLSTIAVGEVARRYPFFIDRSAAAQILWDLGLLGFVSYAGILLSGARRAFSMVKEMPQTSFSCAALDAAGIGLLLALAMLPYGRDLLESPAMQFLLIMMVGYVTLQDVARNDKAYTVSRA